MKHIAVTPSRIIDKTPLALNLIAASVLLTGLLTISNVLFAQARVVRSSIVTSDAHVTLLIGLTLVYLASLLRRGKHTAWLVALPLYIFILIHNLRHFVFDIPDELVGSLPVIVNLVVPFLALAGLIFAKNQFVVRSELRSLPLALRRAASVLLIAFLYGVLGFELLDNHDFHQEISIPTAAHYTVDQFGLTTTEQLTPHTKRSRLFLDSLGVLSVGSLFYVGLSLFAPIRFRLANQAQDRQDMLELLKKYPASSEDFFKLWPPDKAYFFNHTRSAAIAYKASAGIALVVGDPAGNSDEFAHLLTHFTQLCYTNDWSPALIHSEPKYLDLFKNLGFESQKIGEEAVVDINHFQTKVVTNKYFRNIANRFERQRYAPQILNPPHDKALLKRLRQISNDWLKVPGRSERGFMLGYFDENYLQQCVLMVARDSEGIIQAFINQIPSFDPDEANFDLLRSSHQALGNVNDFLVIEFIKYLDQQGFKRLNMGLAPLTGLDKQIKRHKSALDRALHFVYMSGGRFYSFSGLRRFKDKYEPDWQDRYMVYLGGVAGFSKAMNALMRAMRLRPRF